MIEYSYLDGPEITLDRCDEMADAIGCLGLGFFERMPSDKEYKDAFLRGRRECARGGYRKLYYIRNAKPLECAFMDGWLEELSHHYGISLRSYFEAKDFSG